MNILYAFLLGAASVFLPCLIIALVEVGRSRKDSSDQGFNLDHYLKRPEKPSPQTNQPIPK